MTGVSRRAFLIRRATAAVSAVGGAHALGGLLARAALAADGTCGLQALPGEESYGPLEPAGPELALPAGFTYRKFGETGP